MVLHHHGSPKGEWVLALHFTRLHIDQARIAVHRVTAYSGKCCPQPSTTLYKLPTTPYNPLQPSTTLYNPPHPSIILMNCNNLAAQILASPADTCSCLVKSMLPELSHVVQSHVVTEDCCVLHFFLWGERGQGLLLPAQGSAALRDAPRWHSELPG